MLNDISRHILWYVSACSVGRKKYCPNSTLCSDGVDTILSTKREKVFESILKTRSVIYNLGIRSVSHQDSSHPPDEGAVGPLQTNSHRQYNVQ